MKRTAVAKLTQKSNVKKTKVVQKNSSNSSSEDSDYEKKTTKVTKKTTTKPKIVKKHSVLDVSKNFEEPDCNSCEEKEKPAKTTKSKAKKNLLPIVIDHTNKKFRVDGMPWIGAHVSAGGGVDNAVLNATRIHANSFGLFLKNQRQWNIPVLEQTTVDSFRKLCKEHGFDGNQILPHGSYLVNLGNPDAEKRAKGLELFIDDLQRCDRLGIKLYTFHPGSTLGLCTVDESCKHIATSIDLAHAKSKEVIVLLENMAGQGNVVGSKFEDLGKIVKKVKDKERIGVCLDTCHMFAAGYDIRTPESFNLVLEQFDNLVGLQYLKGMHLNDSKGDLGDCKDRHESLGKGKIGINCFKYIMNDKRFHNIPIILETPEEDNYISEIDLCYSFIKNQDLIQ
jgi:AP endonuclease-1